MIRDNYNLLHYDIIARVIQNYNNRLLYSVMYSINYIRGVMVSVIGSIAVDRGFEPRTERYSIVTMWTVRI
jgi:ABC-type transport system involved in multi-copper enzyme maturation permease subunit